MSVSDPLSRLWLALVIGNTRLHWAAFADDRLLGSWHTRHLNPTEAAFLIRQRFAPNSWDHFTTDVIPGQLSAAPQEKALYVASVVPTQSALWHAYPSLRLLHLEQVPLGNLYPTLGIDRALNLLGAGDRYGWPILVIDAGTALTFTAGKVGKLIGGAILPGLAMQFKALGEHTASLPQATIDEHLPDRWARNTPEAIQSGVLYGLIAIARDFLADWHHRYPDASAVITGGDGARLLAGLTAGNVPLPLHQDAELMFWGIRRYRQQSASENR